MSEDVAIGHNSQDELKSYVERIERLEDEKKLLAKDIGDIYLEAKSKGFDGPALREIIRLRKMDAAKRKERESIVETYKTQLAMTF